ncbi:MAG TPA: alpha/beta hydrolase [Candidatus Saccharimonadales bacterium]|nr:alpha/beta hydrolase [Candidatus Saccharimonadales bacterium]
MKQKNVSVDGHGVAYWEANSNEPESVILLHGLGGDHRGLIEFSSYFPSLRVIIPDLPGWGLSEPLDKTHDVKDYVSFLDQFSKQLGLTNFYLVGHSFGGAVALKYTKTYPQKIKKVALLNPVLENSGTISWVFGRGYFNLAALLPDKLCHFLLSNKLIVYVSDMVVMTPERKEYRKKILTQDYRNYKNANTRAMKEGFRALDNLDMEDFSIDIGKDVYFLVGDKDKLQSPKYNEKLERIFANSLVKFVPGGHLLPLEDPELAGSNVSRFIAGEA